MNKLFSEEDLKRFIGMGIGAYKTQALLAQQLLDTMRDNDNLRNVLSDIRHRCSYGWTNIRKECSGIYDIANNALEHPTRITVIDDAGPFTKEHHDYLLNRTKT